MGRYDGWWIEERADGKVDLRRDRRAIAYDLDDVAEAVRLIQRKDPRATEVTIEEVDGYRRRQRLRPRMSA